MRINLLDQCQSLHLLPLSNTLPSRRFASFPVSSSLPPQSFAPMTFWSISMTLPVITPLSLLSRNAVSFPNGTLSLVFSRQLSSPEVCGD